MATNFRLDFTTYEAAKYSVENWHYSRCLPSGKLIKIGVWENSKFIGCIIFSSGANPNIGAPYCLNQQQVCELTRVALTKHSNQVSKFLSVALILLRKKCPSLKLIVSYADPEQDHHGGIYQATNWIYEGITKPETHYISDKGFRIHSKTIRTRGKGFSTKLKKEGKITTVKTYKYKYIYPLEKELKERLKCLSKPYPRKKCSGSTSVHHSEGGVQIDPCAILGEEHA